ncbi:MAG: hypothetical protein R3B68_12700 [Phycisphaerales bacterium]
MPRASCLPPNSFLPSPAPTRADLLAPTTPGDNRIPINPADLLPHPDHPLETIAAHVLETLLTQPPDTATRLHNLHERAATNRDAAAPANTLAELKAETPAAFNIRAHTAHPIHRQPHADHAWLEADIETHDDQRLILRLMFDRARWFHPFHDAWMLSRITTRPPHIPYDPYLPSTCTEPWHRKHRRANRPL